MNDMQFFLGDKNLNHLLQEYATGIVLALIILVVGYFVAKTGRALTRKAMERSKVEPTLISFVCNISYYLLLAFFTIAALAKVGVQTASFVAVIGAAGLAIGLALQGSLSNFAAGVLLILFRPIKVGDFIDGAGASGTVKEIQIFSTVLNTPDNKRVIIPNSALLGGTITNFSAEPTRRIDFIFGVSYSDDILKVREVISTIFAEDERILEDPAPTIEVHQFGDNSVNFVARPWCKREDYWSIYWSVMSKVKIRFDQEGISIPFPQRDVHLYQHNESSESKPN